MHVYLQIKIIKVFYKTLTTTVNNILYIQSIYSIQIIYFEKSIGFEKLQEGKHSIN